MSEHVVLYVSVQFSSFSKCACVGGAGGWSAMGGSYRVNPAFYFFMARSKVMFVAFLFFLPVYSLGSQMSPQPLQSPFFHSN